jgi:hypothetical protein
VPVVGVNENNRVEVETFVKVNPVGAAVNVAILKNTLTCPPPNPLSE